MQLERTAEVAARDFASLRNRFDFIAEGRRSFTRYLDNLVAEGRDPADSMCFVWYVISKQEALAENL